MIFIRNQRKEASSLFDKCNYQFGVPHSLENSGFSVAWILREINCGFILEN